MSEIEIHEKYIRRCIELAKSGLGSVSPNPMVGAVIVHNGKIIGEGFHRKYGEAHAEVNAVNSVKDKTLLKNSKIYVSLEPCAHVGKTPACTDLILREQIPKIYVGSVDPFELVQGKGIRILSNAGRKVVAGILEKECISLNKRFYTFHQKKRPYIILKWAQTLDGYIDSDKKSNNAPSWITNEFCKTLVHKWRTEEDAFLVGTNTVIQDNPQLTARNWHGRNPVRITIDKDCLLDLKKYKIFDTSAETWVFNAKKDSRQNNILYIKADFSKNLVQQIIETLYYHKIQSLVVEGGTETLKSFIEEDLWDEARVFTGNKIFHAGVKSPEFKFIPQETHLYGNSKLEIYYHNEYVLC